MKLLAKNLLLTSIGFATLGSAQLFRTRNRMDNLQDFDEQKFSWGFFLGANNFDYKIVLNPTYGVNALYDANGNVVNYKNAVLSKPSWGFGAGLIGRMRIDDSFDLRTEPSLQFVERKLTFDTQNNSAYAAALGFTPLSLTDQDKERNVKSTYLDIPVLIEYHGDRWYNSRPYMAVGVNYMVNLQSNSKSTDDNQQGIFRTTTTNFAYSAEIGMQFYFRRFKLTPGFRGTFLFNNELVADNAGTPPYWAGAISTMQSRAFMFVLKFE